MTTVIPTGPTAQLQSFFQEVIQETKGNPQTIGARSRTLRRLTKALDDQILGLQAQIQKQTGGAISGETSAMLPDQGIGGGINPGSSPSSIASAAGPAEPMRPGAWPPGQAAAGNLPDGYTGGGEEARSGDPQLAAAAAAQPPLQGQAPIADTGTGAARSRRQREGQGQG